MFAQYNSDLIKTYFGNLTVTWIFPGSLHCSEFPLSSIVAGDTEQTNKMKGKKNNFQMEPQQRYGDKNLTHHAELPSQTTLGEV